MSTPPLFLLLFALGSITAIAARSLDGLGLMFVVLLVPCAALIAIVWPARFAVYHLAYRCVASLPSREPK